jgi:hypothetical protein
MRIAVAALQMFFKDILGPRLEALCHRALSGPQEAAHHAEREEVRRLLAAVHEPRFRVADFPLPDAPFRVIKVLVPTLEGYFSMHGIESGDRCDNEAANRRVRLNSW